MALSIPSVDDVVNDEKPKTSNGFGRRKKYGPKMDRLLALAAQKPEVVDNNFTAACREAGYSVSDKASVSGIKKRFNSIMGEFAQRAGMDREWLASKISEGVNSAEKVHFLKVKDAEGNEKIEVRTSPDHGIRLKYLELLVKITGEAQPVKVEGKMAHSHLVGNITDIANLDKLKKREQALAAEVEIG